MKKSTNVLLSAVFMSMVSSCATPKEWVMGRDDEGNLQDTIVDNKTYRYYRGGWFPVHDNMIHVPYYAIHSGNVTVASRYHLRHSGFGSSARHSNSVAS